MDVVMVNIVWVFVTAIVTSFGGACFGALLMSLKSIKLLKAAIGELLWRELKTMHMQAVNDGGLNTEDRKHLDAVYQAYHAMGLNGTGTKLYEDTIDMPIF